MAARRRLIVNADDFGLSSGVNRGIVAAHARGIVTSASLMTRHGAAAEAAEWGRCQPRLSIGLHVDLGEWVCHDGDWCVVYSVAPLSDAGAIAEAVNRQLAAFRQLMGSDPTHIDSHQHVHRREPVRSVLLGVAQELEIPLRDCSEVGYCGQFYGQTSEGSPLPDAISVEHLVGIVEGLPAGLTELACHPGEPEELTTMYRTERFCELGVLCDARVRATIVEGAIELCSFHDVARERDASEIGLKV